MHLSRYKSKYYYKREQEEAIGGLKIMRDGTTVMIGMVSGNIVFCDFSTDKFIEKTNQVIYKFVLKWLFILIEIRNYYCLFIYFFGL